MLIVGLTGGIGSGKSTVARRLAARGATVIDADAITRQLQRPGTEVFDRIVERFGPGVVGPDGGLDRPALAAVVFNDPGARRDLEAIVHPAVAAEAQRRIGSIECADGIVVYDVPLLVEAARGGFDTVVVVDVDPEVAVRRLVEQRGMDEADVRARMASQAGRPDRLAAADRVVDNSDGLDDLDRRVDELWDWLQKEGS
ncbi:MAG: dephospho-CoA kinase [Acidimicrobiales bacterium]